MPRLVVALVVLCACSDETPHRPPPPPEEDAGAFDAAALPDASIEPDAAPQLDGGINTSTIHRDYGTDFDACPALQVPLWGDLSWTATVPAGSSIAFSAQAAPAGESLSAAARVRLGTTPPATSPLYVADALAVEHRNDPQLRITAVLRWSAAETEPTLERMNLDWECLDRP